MPGTSSATPSSASVNSVCINRNHGQADPSSSPQQSFRLLQFTALLTISPTGSSIVRTSLTLDINFSNYSETAVHRNSPKNRGSSVSLGWRGRENSGGEYHISADPGFEGKC
jgi:subtilisin family serine protease